MIASTTALRIVIADDDADDRYLTERALRTAEVGPQRDYVASGEELLAYLRPDAVDGAPSPARAGLILLDLRMPGLDGFGTLERIKADPRLRAIPVIVFTTSRSEADAARCYDLGVNSFVTKPGCFDDLVAAVATLGQYWFTVVKLPGSTA